MPTEGRRRRIPVHAPGRRTRLLALALSALLPLAPAGASAGDRGGPLAVDQPYLGAIGAPDALPPLRPVLVGVVDAGVDTTHPDLAPQIAESRRFVRGDAGADETHGTATSGLIAAIRGNGAGIDGIAPNARLLVADVVAAGDGAAFDELAVDRAIRWAADRGARVLNLSLAGPPTPGRQEAIDYAVRSGVLVVAAAGNCWDGIEPARCPRVTEETWPAWLPHVLAVGATGDDYARPTAAAFSVPSARWVDVAAPGVLITTLWPIRSNPYAPTPGCAFVGTTACYRTGGASDRRWGPTGTSYAAPMVAAAAAILFGAAPSLQPGQVMRLLEETARPLREDPRHQTGAGLLDIGAALARVRAGRIPPRDLGEPNELPAAPFPLRPGAFAATVDWFDDPEDDYALDLGAGTTVTVRSRGTLRAGLRVVLRGKSVASGRIGGALRVTAPRRPGRATIEVTAAPGARGSYHLDLRRTG
jgi:hypothetical protein